MAAAVGLRDDFDAGSVRAARRSKDGGDPAHPAIGRRARQCGGEASTVSARTPRQAGLPKPILRYGAAYEIRQIVTERRAKHC